MSREVGSSAPPSAMERMQDASLQDRPPPGPGREGSAFCRKVQKGEPGRDTVSAATLALGAVPAGDAGASLLAPLYPGRAGERVSFSLAHVGAALGSPYFWRHARGRAKGRESGGSARDLVQAAARSPASCHPNHAESWAPQNPKISLASRRYKVVIHYPSPEEVFLPTRRRSCSRAFYPLAPGTAHALFTARLPSTAPRSELFISLVGFFHGSLIRVS